jgi:hypothetical protein
MIQDTFYKWLPIDEAADELETSERHVRRLARAFKLMPKRIQGELHVSAYSVEQVKRAYWYTPEPDPPDPAPVPASAGVPVGTTKTE